MKVSTHPLELKGQKWHEGRRSHGVRLSLLSNLHGLIKDAYSLSKWILHLLEISLAYRDAALLPQPFPLSLTLPHLFVPYEVKEVVPCSKKPDDTTLFITDRIRPH